VEISEEPRTYIAVAPMDAEETPGELSNMVIIPNHSPVAALIADPMEGEVPLQVSFDASASSDIDGPIVKYEWDWEGDGVYDYDSGSVAEAEHTYDVADYYDPQVRVTLLRPAGAGDRRSQRNGHCERHGHSGRVAHIHGGRGKWRHVH